MHLSKFVLISRTWQTSLPESYKLNAAVALHLFKRSLNMNQYFRPLCEFEALMILHSLQNFFLDKVHRN